MACDSHRLSGRAELWHLAGTALLT